MGQSSPRSLTIALVMSLLATLPICGRASAQAVTTAFTYQGELRENGELVNGVYDFRFKIYPIASGPTPAYQTICVDDVEVVDGRFTTQIDYGYLLFRNSEVLYLELDVRPGDVGTCADQSGFETLAGRTLISPTPYAIASLSSGTATTANALAGIPAASFARRDAANTWTAPNTFNGLQIFGDLNASQSLFANAVVAQQTVGAFAPEGTPPLMVSSNTKVNNLNADLIDGVDSPQFARRDLPNTFGTGNSFAGLQVNGDLAASQNVFANAVVAQQTIAALAPQGVAPFQVASTFKVNNLNVDLLDGVDSPQFARRDQPNTFGLGNTFAGLQVNGDLAASQNVFAIGIIAQQVAATAPQGTAPLIVSSTTKVTNLNADLLDGVAGAGYARLGGVNNFANDNTFNNVNVLGDFTGDTVAANTFALRNTAIRTLTIPAFAFQTDGQIPYFRGAHELRGTSAGTVVSAYTAVQLPNGAKIESISYNFFDNGSSDLTLVLRESSFSAIPLDTPIVVLNTSGAFPAFATNTHNFPTPYPVVDNTTKSYYLSLTIPVPATPANLRIGDVHIQYLVDELAP